MLARIALLFSITLLMRLTEPLFHVETESLSMAVSGQSLIILCGGIFLLYKSVTEIHHKIESENPTEEQQAESGNSFASVIIQIVLLDIVFSLDSVLTAVGMVSFADFGRAGALSIMVAAVVIAVGIMLIFSGPISRFVNAHPSVQMLALSFLILISVTLLMEAGHLAHLVIMDTVITELPKGYIYFAISFSLLVEMLNMRVSRRKAD
jgi:predicted tellurium resistance membrane protein TerC